MGRKYRLEDYGPAPKKDVGLETDFQKKENEDVVNQPSHYITKLGIESIDVIEAFELNFCKANSVKYILRSGKKDNEIQDLKKAIWYLKREIMNLEKQLTKTI